jgi:hypothetical protein
MQSPAAVHHNQPRDGKLPNGARYGTQPKTKLALPSECVSEPRHSRQALASRFDTLHANRLRGVSSKTRGSSRDFIRPRGGGVVSCGWRVVGTERFCKWQSPLDATGCASASAVLEPTNRVGPIARQRHWLRHSQWHPTWGTIGFAEWMLEGVGSFFRGSVLRLAKTARRKRLPTPCGWQRARHRTRIALWRSEQKEKRFVCRRPVDGRGLLV